MKTPEEIREKLYELEILLESSMADNNSWAAEKYNNYLKALSWVTGASVVL